MPFPTVNEALAHAAREGFQVRRQRQNPQGQTEVLIWDHNMNHGVLLVGDPLPTLPFVETPSLSYPPTDVSAQPALFPEKPAPAVPSLVPATTTPTAATAPRVSGEGKHFSFSQLTKYSMCGMSYFFRYIMGLPMRKNTNLVFGSSVHSAIEFDYRYKMSTGVNEALSAKQDKFVETFDAEWANPEIVREPDETRDDHVKMGVELVKQHHEQIAVHTIPIAVEERVLISIPGIPVPVLGFVDLIERMPIGSLQITDHKTSKKKYDLSAAKTSYQLGIYAKHKGIEDVNFDVFCKTKKPEVQRVPGKITETYGQYVESVFEKTYRAVQAGIFLPAKPGEWPCTSKACEYWDQCVGKSLK